MFGFLVYFGIEFLWDFPCIQTECDLDSEQLLNIRDGDFFFQKRDLNAVGAISNEKIRDRVCSEMKIENKLVWFTFLCVEFV